MKDHGMGLNTFTEYQWNPVFAGRNWNGGETIELVLRRKDGRFLPMGYLISVMAHELAHIHHMNHGTQFQRLNRQIRHEINLLQQRGYFGPGFWSSGKRLNDSATLIGDGSLVASELPEYTCGGSNSNNSRRRVYRIKATRKRKRRPDRFIGEGQKLEPSSSFFRKRANAAGAKEARARAAEDRIRKAKELESSAISSEQTDENIEGVEVVELESDWEELESDENKLNPEDDKKLLREEMEFLLQRCQANEKNQTDQRLNNEDENKKPELIELSDGDDVEIISVVSSEICDGGQKQKSSFKNKEKSTSTSTSESLSRDLKQTRQKNQCFSNSSQQDNKSKLTQAFSSSKQTIDDDDIEIIEAGPSVKRSIKNKKN
ncbi:WLM domain-containing protein [Phakopsora pachyrhizi]|nr:WLM domain-containing protein [Phakopsora pachyrhizi]